MFEHVAILLCRSAGSCCRRVPAVLLAAALALLLGGCSAFTDKPDITRNWPVQRLYGEAKAALNEGDYETAIDYYEKLESRFPFGRYAQQAQVDLAYAYWKDDQPSSAIAAAERFIKLHPRHPNVDYAYYLRGMVNFTQGENFMDRIMPRDMSLRDPGSVRQAFDDFSELVRRFPQSKYSEDARQRMVYLRNVLARHEVHVADYYMTRTAFLAAANRARFVVENYQRTDAVPDALVIMAKAYAFMDLDDLSADVVRVLELNYPEHDGLTEVRGLKKN
jgi:outer membrane protein assembly factor BamD